jgi:flagellin-like hook-associated protein FlgL
MFYNQFLTGIDQTLAAQLKDGNEISSGKTISEPSDNPTALTQIVDYQTQLSNITEYTKAQNSANAQLQSLDSALSNLSDTVSQANQLAISALGGTTDAESRLMISDQVTNLYNTAISIANTKSGSSYIFAGDQSNVQPINPTTGELTGNANSFNINISQGLNISANVSAGSLFSFKRVNTTDSTTAILPTYNWQNNGANTIPDADPASALETTVPSSPIYTINPGDSISIGGVSYTLDAANGSPLTFTSANDLANYLNTATAGSNVSFSYDSANNKFKMTNTNAGAAVKVNWQGSTTAATPTTMNVEQALGFSAIGDQTISASGNIESNNTVGKFTASDDIFTTNGGAFNVTVNSSATPSSGAFVINNTNNAIVIDGTTYNINNGIYTGATLASALSALGGGNLINATYDSTAHRFTIASPTGGGGATTVDFGATAAGTTTIGQILGYNDSNAGNIATGLTSDNVVGDVNLAAGSTLQDARDAFNTASAGVKAEVVNEGTAANPDFRLVVASDPVGSSADIDISTLSNPRTTGSSIAAGGTITGSSISGSFNINSSDNTIQFSDGGTNHVATIAAGTYTGTQLATQISLALKAQDNVAFSSTSVSYTAGNAFAISSASANAVNISWSNSTVQPQQLGFGASAVADASGAGVNMLSYDKTTGDNMTLGTNITNYNYITQASANDSIVIDDGTNGGVANNQIVFQENGGSNITAKIARGTYTPDQLAAAVASALTNATGAVNTYTASYDSNTGKFIINNTAGGDTFKFLWSNASSTATTLLGNNQTDSATFAAGTTGIASNNAVLANYYSFNNNYLNDNNILRALNFLNVSLQNNDSGRIGQAIQYTSDLSDVVSERRADVGSRENEITDVSNYQASVQTDTTTSMSNLQDTDVAKVASDLSQQQATLQALLTMSATVLQQNLFSFLK